MDEIHFHRTDRRKVLFPMDGKITLSDSMAALRTALGLDGFDPERRELSDYNCDGAISVEDAVAIAKKVMHIV